MQTEITPTQLNEAIFTMESVQASRDFQKISDILPLVLIILKDKAKDLENQSKGTKFYVPIWVSALLNRLSSDERPLSEVEYQLFKSDVASLSFIDYKSAEPTLNGYEVQYLTPQEIIERVVALKHYLKLL